MRTSTSEDRYLALLEERANAAELISRERKITDVTHRAMRYAGAAAAGFFVIALVLAVAIFIMLAVPRTA
jgi:hypothetical protein